MAQSYSNTTDFFFAVERQRGTAWNAQLPMNQQSNWDEHAQFMNRLAADGIVQQGGPLDDGEEILLIVKATDAQQARAAFADDPWTKAGLLEIKRVRRWAILLQAKP